MKKSHITRERVMQLVGYDPMTGLFVWRVVTSNCVKVGQFAGTLHHSGYVRIQLDGRRYAAHRIAWLYVTGEWPADELDHVNGKRADNRFANLRLASRRENMGNRSKRSDNASGAKGVSWHKQHSKWTAQIRCNGRRYHLGYFSTVEEANAAYQGAASLVFGEFAHHNRNAAHNGIH